ncbi:MAG: CoA transferase [Dehalococcoidales bacterium]|nr:CoA transferase [Dehalococcoidales bacterium]
MTATGRTHLLPLEGVKIIDFTTAWAGPVCTMMLADMGAEVIKIENPQVPDASRGWPPFAEGDKTGGERSGFFAFFNRGKKDCVLDLKQPGNIEKIKCLVSQSDVVIENYAPRVMANLGLSYSILREHKPDLVMVSLSGYGANGPDRDCVAYGPVLEAYCGLSSLLTYPGGEANQCGIMITDHIAAISAAYVTLAALHHRNLTGQGQYIELSEVETALACMPEAVMEYTFNRRVPQAHGNKDECMMPHSCYQCREASEWIAITVDNDRAWRRLCRVMGMPALIKDRRFQDSFCRWKNQATLDEIIGKWAKQHSCGDITQKLRKADIAASPVYNDEQLHANPQLKARQFYVNLDHPVVGTRELPGVFAKLSRTPGKVRGRAPLFGEHTGVIFEDPNHGHKKE